MAKRTRMASGYCVMETQFYLIPDFDYPMPNVESFLGIIVRGAGWKEKLAKLFTDARQPQDFSLSAPLIVREYKAGVSNPMAEALAHALGEGQAQSFRIDKLLLCSTTPSSEIVEKLRVAWREPAIEDLNVRTLSEWMRINQNFAELKPRTEDSFKEGRPSEWNLEFSEQELEAISKEQTRIGRSFNRAELELIAQTWSEHCKHKIFAAHIQTLDTENTEIRSLFDTFIRRPTQEIMASDLTPRCLSVFHDNAGVLALSSQDGASTEWAYCLKMETHNSPSAISPYGGASTGLVGVHRDILGTGLGAMPIANWNVLCFESPEQNLDRPSQALPADIVRSGVLRGIEHGGNQSGVPTVQGSVVFDADYAVKPLVFAGAVGLLKKSFVEKKPKAGLKLYCLGGAVGADGLRGAVMSSRDLRGDDFTGSAVQVADAFTQRRLTDFLMEARDLGLIDSLTDNGAGGLGSSVGEMADRTGGARIDVSKLRLKFNDLKGWERLLSESQERMTLATSQPAELEALAAKWNIGYDAMGELNSSGKFQVEFESKLLVDISLSFLHEGVPKLSLKSEWSLAKEVEALGSTTVVNSSVLYLTVPNLIEDFSRMLRSVHLASREKVARRFDHEVQGRTLRKPFGGSFQNSAQDGSLIEIHESSQGAAIVLSHGLSPWRKDIVENVLNSFDEAYRTALIAGMNPSTAGGLDNFCWPDPIPSPANPQAHRRLWRLVRSCEVLAHLCREFKLPLVSGKDSMKNNSSKHACPETLVISIGASAKSWTKIPAGFFSKANDVVFMLPPLRGSLRDSAWERCLGLRSKVESHSADWKSVVPELKARYQRLEILLGEGKLRSVKDISEGGAIMALFEMCLGESLGLHFESNDPNSDELLKEGLGGFVFGVDPHHAGHIAQEFSGIIRLGVVARDDALHWSTNKRLELSKLKSDYSQRGMEGFWT